MKRIVLKSLVLIFMPTLYCSEQKRVSMPIASYWHHLAQGQQLNRYQMRKLFIDDVARYATLNESIAAHQKNDQTVRIATYNVHSWKDSQGKKNFDGIMKTIGDINPDVLVLQEVTLFDWPLIQKSFKDLGYIGDKSLFVQAAGHFGLPFGNMIVSKYPLVGAPVRKTFDADKAKWFGEKRAYVKACIGLPHNKQITVFGTHLDVHDKTESLRVKEIKELVSTIAQEKGPCIIAADCNAVRASDYQYAVGGKLVWDMLKESDKKRTGFETPVAALKILQDNNFTDSFLYARQQSPKFTVWSGTTVDYLWLSPQWNLPVVHSAVYYSAASDHLPIIMDVNIA